MSFDDCISTHRFALQTRIVYLEIREVAGCEVCKSSRTEYCFVSYICVLSHSPFSDQFKQ